MLLLCAQGITERLARTRNIVVVVVVAVVVVVNVVVVVVVVNAVVVVVFSKISCVRCFKKQELEIKLLS